MMTGKPAGNVVPTWDCARTGIAEKINNSPTAAVAVRFIEIPPSNWLRAEARVAQGIGQVNRCQMTRPVSNWPTSPYSGDVAFSEGEVSPRCQLLDPLAPLLLAFVQLDVGCPARSAFQATSARRILLRVVDLGILWPSGTFPGFDKRFQAHQKDPPLAAAMVHELHRLLPTLVFEEDDGVVAILFELPTYFCADPFSGPVDHLP